MRILIITEALSYPPASGAPLRTYSLMLRIAQEHEVWLATLLDAPSQVKGLTQIRSICMGVESAVYRQRHPLAHLPGLIFYALTGRPLELRFKYSSELVRKIHQLASKVDFDIVQIEHSDMALYLGALPTNARCKRILVLHNVIFGQYDRIFRVQQRWDRKVRAWLHSRMMRYWEPQYAERFGRCVTVSEADRRLLSKANPRLQVEVIPNGVDTHIYQAIPQECRVPSVLFIGMMEYVANSDAALYFCHEILPLIRQTLSEVEVWIVGMNPPPKVMNLNGDGVHVTGRVDDIVPYYTQSSVCVVPLRAGGGTRLKILEAMALGRPVVTTSIGCEGLNVVDNQHLLVADSPEQFSECVIRLLQDPILYKRITANARRLVETQYDWDISARQMLQIYDKLYHA